MIKFALLAAAAKKSGRSLNTDGIEAFAVCFVIIPAILLGGMIFIACPIGGIVGAANLFANNKETATELLATGAFGGVLNFLIGGGLIARRIVEELFPEPYDFESKSPTYNERRKQNRIGCVKLLIGSLVLFAIVTCIAGIAIYTMASNVILSGILFIILFSLSLIIMAGGAILEFLM